MGGNELVTAFIRMVPEVAGIQQQTARAFKPAEDAADKSGKKAGGRFSGAFGGAAKKMMGPALALVSVGAAGSFLKDSIAEARESQKVGALTTQLLKNNAGAAGVNAKEVGDLATSISNKTGLDDEAVQAASNSLIAYRNVGNQVGKNNDIFTRATKASVDFSASTGGSAVGASKKLGKALNDPFRGYKKLAAMGVTFTAGQEKQIKKMGESGDTLGAQKILLAAVEKRYKGAGAASATTGEKLATTWANFKESMGTKLLPVLDKLMKFLTNKVLPAVSAFAGLITNNAKVIKLLAMVLAPLIAGLLVYKSTVAIVGVATRAWGTAQLFLNGAMRLNPIGLVITALVALGIGLVLLWKKSETFRNIVLGTWAAIKTATGAVFGWMKAFIPAAWNVIKQAFSATVGALVKIVKVGFYLLTLPIRIQIAVIKKIVQGVMFIGRFFREAFGKALAAVREKIAAIIAKVTGIKTAITGAVSGFGKLLFGAGSRLIGGLIKGIKSRIKDVTGVVGGVAGKVKGFFPGSPIKEGPLKSWNRGGAGKRLMGQLASGISASKGSLAASMKGVSSVVSGNAPIATYRANSASMPAGNSGGGGSRTLTYNNYGTPGMSSTEELFAAASRSTRMGGF